MDNLVNLELILNFFFSTITVCKNEFLNGLSAISEQKIKNISRHYTK